MPVRVEEVPAAEMPAVLRPLVFRDLFGVAEEQARQVLLEAVAGPRRPDQQAGVPGAGTPGALSRLGGSGPRLPGSVPRVWNVPARNPGFTGRDGLLVAVRERLLAGDRAVVQALQGMGGVGKTQLAVEYAHRFAGTYDLAWWVNCRAGRADRRPVRRPRRRAGLRCSPGQAPRWCARRCWPSCGSGAGGCWCSTTPRTPPT